MAKDNIISDLQKQGFIVTSDPTWFNPWGYRNLWQYGIWADGYSKGYHRAYDLAKWHNAPIKSGVNGTVLAGTGFGGFGYQLVIGFVATNGKRYQIIYGHLNRNPLTYLRIGQNVKKGQVVAYQGASNNLGVSMASHLHIQMQNFGYLNQYDFITKGINPLNVDISKTSPTSGTVSTTSKPANSKNTTNNETPSTFNKRKGRKTRNKAYAKGVIRSTNGKGAALRRYSGGTFRKTFGNDLPDGSVIYIFATHKTGWAKVYSPQNKGWVHLDQVKITEVY